MLEAGLSSDDINFRLEIVIIASSMLADVWTEVVSVDGSGFTY